MAAALLVPSGADAQEENHYRVGITLGGTAFVSLAVEYRFGNAAVDFTVGTFGLRDLSLSMAGKYYVGENRVRPYVGAGLWSLFAFSEEERTGWALILRVPVGLDWTVADANAFGLEVNLNRAVAVRRTDPMDTRGPRSRIVPFPAIYYRWASRQPPGR